MLQWDGILSGRFNLYCRTPISTSDVTVQHNKIKSIAFGATLKLFMVKGERRGREDIIFFFFSFPINISSPWLISCPLITTLTIYDELLTEYALHHLQNATALF